jgi:predicted NUDIX family NTP pyrophosphohydrolase
MPKGLVEPGEDLEAAARREFAEEVGTLPSGPLQPLGRFVQSGSKTVVAFALAGEFDPTTLVSNRIAIEWPPRSGRTIDIPEIDRAGWFDLPTALRKVHKGQQPIVTALADLLGTEL